MDVTFVDEVSTKSIAIKQKANIIQNQLTLKDFLHFLENQLSVSINIFKTRNRKRQDIFRHAFYLHPIYFHAIVNLTHLMLEHGESLYSIDF